MINLPEASIAPIFLMNPLLDLRFLEYSVGQGSHDQLPHICGTLTVVSMVVCGTKDAGNQYSDSN